jgi:hypothetical protein
MKQPRNGKASVPGGQTAAEEIAIQALGFLASDSEELGRFLALTGIEPDQIREAAQQPGFLAGVLEYVCAHEPLLLAFARDSTLEPARIERGLEALAGRRWSRDVP